MVISPPCNSLVRSWQDAGRYDNRASCSLAPMRETACEELTSGELSQEAGVSSDRHRASTQADEPEPVAALLEPGLLGDERADARRVEERHGGEINSMSSLIGDSSSATTAAPRGRARPCRRSAPVARRPRARS